MTDGTHQRASSPVRAALQTIRPKQWVKNLFVVAPLVFSKHLLDGSHALRAAAAFGVFCALSGAVYAFNDLRDAPADRLHPQKQYRPIAAGHLSERAAVNLAIALAIAGLAGSAALSLPFAAVAAGYLLNNVAYTLVLKRIAFVDVASIAAGFLLRVIGGAFAIAVAISPWLVTCTALLAALLGFGKRAHELVSAQRAGRAATATRAALRGYGLRMLKWVLVTMAVATCVAYALYTRDHRTIAFFATEHLVWTLPFCVIGIGRFLQLALWRPLGDSPTDAILRDWPFLLNMAVWGSAVIAIIYS